MESKRIFVCGSFDLCQSMAPLFLVFCWASEPGFGVEIGHGPSGLDTSSGTRVRYTQSASGFPRGGSRVVFWP